MACSHVNGSVLSFAHLSRPHSSHIIGNGNNIGIVETSPAPVLGLRLRQTCRAFRNIIEGSASLRYKLALSESGMCDEPRSRMTVAEKLDLLTAHAAAGRSLHAVQQEWVVSLVGWSSLVAVSGNILVFTRRCSGARGEHDASFSVAPTEAYFDLLVVRVPSPLRRIEGAQWMLWLPEGVGELCIDAAQDLLVYAQCVVLSCLSSAKGSLHCGLLFLPHLLLGVIRFVCACCLPAVYTRWPLDIRVVSRCGKVTPVCPSMSSASACAVITSLPARGRSSYPSGTGRRGR